MVNYNEKYVNIASIKMDPPQTNEIEYRYKLEIDLVAREATNKNSKKTLLVIMMNPSKAKTDESDRTVNRVAKYAWCEGYKTVLIYNSMPYYGTTKSEVTALETTVKEDEDILTQNMKDIEKELMNMKSKDLFLATGVPQEYFEKYVWQIHEIINKEKISFLAAKLKDSGQVLSNKNYTFHPIYTKNKMRKYSNEHGKILDLNLVGNPSGLCVK